VPAHRLIELDASEIVGTFDWWPCAERLAASIGEQLTRERRIRRPPALGAAAALTSGSSSQLELSLAPEDGGTGRARTI
jgi:hypothetical protein